MPNWSEGGYTYYGVQSLSHTAATQPQDSSTCWAYSLGALLGVSWNDVALHAPLDAMSRGLGFAGESNELVVSLNKIGTPLGWPHLISLNRWFSADWDGPMLETKFPQVTAVKGHFVVSLAVGKKAGQPDMIRYWDPLDAQIHIETMQGFAQAKSPNTVGSVARG